MNKLFHCARIKVDFIWVSRDNHYPNWAYQSSHTNKETNCLSFYPGTNIKRYRTYEENIIVNSILEFTSLETFKYPQITKRKPGLPVPKQTLKKRLPRRTNPLLFPISNHYDVSVLDITLVSRRKQIKTPLYFENIIS